MNEARIWDDAALESLRQEFGDVYGGRTVLVTGADGFMGSHLTDALVELGANVHAFVRATSSGALNNIGHLRKQLKVHFADLTDRTSIDYLVRELREAPDKPYVFHLGAQAHVGESWHRPYETVMANTVGTLNLLQSIVDWGLELEKFDTAGTSEEYGNVREAVAHHHDFDEAGALILHERSPINPKSIYATAKVAADFLTMNYHDAFGVPGVVTRMFNNYGPRQNPRYVTGTIITQALTRPTIELGALEPLRDFCFCTDGVRGHLTVAAHGDPGRRLRLRPGREHLDGRLGRPDPPRGARARLLARRPRGRDDPGPPAPRRHRRDGAPRRLREAARRDGLEAARLLGGGRPAHDRLVRREPRPLARPRRLADNGRRLGRSRVVPAVKVAFVYANSRSQQVRLIEAGLAPDTSLLGQNHLFGHGIDATIAEPFLQRKQPRSRPLARIAWNARELTLPWELDGAHVVCTTVGPFAALAARLRPRLRTILLNINLCTRLERASKAQRAALATGVRSADAVVCFAEAQRVRLLEHTRADPARCARSSARGRRALPCDPSVPDRRTVTSSQSDAISAATTPRSRQPSPASRVPSSLSQARRT